MDADTHLVHRRGFTRTNADQCFCSRDADWRGSRLWDATRMDAKRGRGSRIFTGGGGAADHADFHRTRMDADTHLDPSTRIHADERGSMLLFTGRGLARISRGSETLSTQRGRARIHALFTPDADLRGWPRITRSVLGMRTAGSRDDVRMISRSQTWRRAEVSGHRPGQSSSRRRTTTLCPILLRLQSGPGARTERSRKRHV